MLNLLIIAIVCFLASTLGPLCGIGGGVTIKPIVDSLGVMGMATTSFLSSLTVLTMSLSTLAQQGWARARHPERPATPYPPTALPLSLGAATGGVAGKVVFNAISGSLGSAETVGAIQAAVLFALSAAAIAYTLLRSRVSTLHVAGAVPSALIGAVTGAMWAFLGIGGGTVQPRDPHAAVLRADAGRGARVHPHHRVLAGGKPRLYHRERQRAGL